MYNILEQGKWLNVVIDSNANEYKPLLMLGTRLFDPADSMRPVGGNPRAKSLSKDYFEEAQELLAKAKENYEMKRLEPPSGRQLGFPDIPVVTRLEVLLAESVARVAADNVVAAAKPMIDKFIQNTYGILPKRTEVTSPKGNFVVQGITHEKFETVLNIVNQNIPVFLTGPAGSGKNVLCKQISEALGLDFYFSNAVTHEYKLTGFIDANGHFHDTQFYKAFTNGGLFMLDEMDASTPEVLVVLNAAIANKYFDFPTGRVDAHEDFRVVAAGNTYGTGADIEYTGRYQLDAASLDRFAIIEINYSEAIEDAITNGNKELVSFVRDFRSAVNKARIKFIVSYRAMERLSKLEQVFEKGEAIKIALLKGLEADDVQTIYASLPNSSYKEAMRLIA
jgi:hypothetical protein